MLVDSLKKFSEEANGKLIFDYDLKKTNWFNIGGNAKAFFKPENLKDLVNFLKIFGNKEKIFILGAGSNILIKDKGFDGVVVKLGKNFSNISILPNKTIIAGSASMDKSVAKFSVENEVGGLEFLSCIPGSIGGGIRMNSGCFGTEFKDILLSVQAVDRTGNVLTIPSVNIKFEYRTNDLPKDLIFLSASFKGKFKNKDIGTIKMEVIRNTAPKGNFLQNVRKLANKFNKILIFDECSTGFRETFGGIYKKYGVEPDMVIYGKALGNGYPISCVVGKKEIMDTKRKTFISSTFWTERIGPAAALETLKIMEREKSWKIISKIGKKVKKNWQKLSLKYKIPLTIQGIPALTNFYFNDEKNNLKYRSFIIQYLLKKKYLASNTFYSSIAHTDEILDGYFSILDEAFYELSRSIKKQDLDQKLNYPISYNTFRK